MQKEQFTHKPNSRKRLISAITVNVRRRPLTATDAPQRVVVAYRQRKITQVRQISTKHVCSSFVRPSELEQLILWT
jgi:hypothetical protein